MVTHILYRTMTKENKPLISVFFKNEKFKIIERHFFDETVFGKSYF